MRARRPRSQCGFACGSTRRTPLRARRPRSQCGLASDTVASYLVSWTFRFRGKTGRLLRLVDCFLAEPGKGLSPAHLGREAGIGLYDAARLLEQTPELFVKLPGRGDGITRYRLSSSVAARGEDGIVALVRRHERLETWIFYLLAVGALLLGAVVLLAVAPQLL